MGMMTVALVLLIAISQQIKIVYGDLSVPFTHDFNTSLHGWNVGERVWHWTGHSNRIDSKTSISFDKKSNYIWSRKSCLGTRPATQHHLLYSQSVINVTMNSKFHFKYWFYTKDSDCGFLSFSLLTTDHGKVTKTVTHNSSNVWDDVTIDCQVDNCCKEYNCDLRLFISGSVGCKGAEDLIIIRSVSATHSEQVIPTEDSKLNMNFKTERPKDSTTPDNMTPGDDIIPDEPPTSSAATTPKSNNSTIKLSGPTTALGTPIKPCQEILLCTTFLGISLQNSSSMMSTYGSGRYRCAQNNIPPKVSLSF